MTAELSAGNGGKSAMKNSEILSNFLNMLSEAERMNMEANQQLERLDKLTQDYLHGLEFCQYKDRSKVATALSRVRKERRKWKDIKEETDVLAEWVEANKGVYNKMREMLGQLRKVEKYHNSERIYIPKSTESEDILQNL